MVSSRTDVQEFFDAQRRLEFSPVFQGRERNGKEVFVASATAEPSIQSSLTRRGVLEALDPALKDRAKFEPPLRVENLRERSFCFASKLNLRLLNIIHDGQIRARSVIPERQ